MLYRKYWGRFSNKTKRCVFLIFVKETSAVLRLECRTSTSNAAEAELSKSSRTQITLETVSSLCCHLVTASAAWWQKLRDSGGVSSPRPSDSWTQTQPLKGIVHFEIKIWYLSAYPKGIQDVGVFFFFSRSNFDVFRSNRSSLSVI